MDNKWVYMSSLERIDFFLNFIDITFLIFGIIRGKKLFYYEFVFSFIKKMIYSTFFALTLGPLINVSKIIIIIFISRFYLIIIKFIFIFKISFLNL